MLSGLIEYIWGPDGNNQNMEKENSPDGDDRHSDHDQFEIVLLEVNETIGDDWVYIEQQEKPLQGRLQEKSYLNAARCFILPLYYTCSSNHRCG